MAEDKSLEEQVLEQIELTNKIFDKEDEIKKLLAQLNAALVNLNLLYIKAGRTPVDIEDFVLKHIIGQAQLDNQHKSAEEKKQSEETQSNGGAAAICSDVLKDDDRKKSLCSIFKPKRVKPYRFIRENEFEGISLE